MFSRLCRALGGAVHYVVFLIWYCSIRVSAQTLDVCPYNPWQDLPLVKKPTPAAKFSDPLGWSADETKTYVEKEVAPKTAGNVALLVMMLAMLLVFILWRTIRACCVLGCCKEKCDGKRAMHDPFLILTSKHVLYVKIAVILVGVTSIAWFIVGMVRLDKGIVGDATTVVNRLLDYCDTTLDSVDAVVKTSRNLNTNMDGITSVVYKYANFPSLRSNLTCLDNYLSSPSGYPDLQNQLNTVNSSLETWRITLDQDNLDKLQVEAKQTGAANNLAAIPGKLSDMTLTITAVTDAIDALPGTNPGASDPSITNLDDKLTTLGTSLSDWTGTGPGSVLQLKRDIADFDSWANGVEMINYDWTSFMTTMNSSSGLSKTLSASLSNLDCMKALIDQARVINASLVGFTGQTASNLATIDTAYTSINSPSSPVTLATISNDLDSLDASLTFVNEFQSLLNGNIEDASSAIANRPRGGALTTIYNRMDDLNNALINLQTGVTAAQALLTAYQGSPNDANYNLMTAALAAAKGQASTARTASSTVTNQLNAGDPSLTTAANRLAATLPQLDAAMARILPQRDAAKARISTVQGYISTFISDNLNAMLRALPPASAATLADTVLASVNTLDNTMNKTVGSVRSDINRFVKEFESSTNKVRNTSAEIRDDVKDQQDQVEKIDNIRYNAIQGILGLAILLLLLLAVFVWLNTQAGITWTLLILALVLILFFLVSVVMAASVVILRDVCEYSEDILLAEVANSKGDQGKLIANYYLVPSQNQSLEQMLKSADILDVDQARLQVNNARTKIVADITKDFTIRPALNAELSALNTTIDAALGHVETLMFYASYSSVVGNYLNVKSYICCDVAEELGQLWETLTYGGALAILMMLLAAYHLTRLDDLPRVDCCGCTCHHPKDFADLDAMAKSHRVIPVTVSPMNGNGSYSDPNGLAPTGDSKFDSTTGPYHAPQPQELEMPGQSGGQYPGQYGAPYGQDPNNTQPFNTNHR